MGNNSPQCDGLRDDWYTSSGPSRVATGNFNREARGVVFVSRRVVFVMIRMNSGLRPLFGGDWDRYLGVRRLQGYNSLRLPRLEQSFFLSNIFFLKFWIHASTIHRSCHGHGHGPQKKTGQTTKFQNSPRLYKPAWSRCSISIHHVQREFNCE